jgi:hypothetical protein
LKEVEIDPIVHDDRSGIAESIPRDVSQPPRDDNLLHRQPPGFLNTIAWLALKIRLQLLDQICFGPLASRELRNPFGGFPPSGHNNVRVGEVTIADRSVGFDYSVLKRERFEIRTARNFFRPTVAREKQLNLATQRRHFQGR